MGKRSRRSAELSGSRLHLLPAAGRPIGRREFVRTTGDSVAAGIGRHAPMAVASWARYVAHPGLTAGLRLPVVPSYRREHRFLFRGVYDR